jgi:glutamine synthetase
MEEARSLGFDEAWFAPEIEFFVFRSMYGKPCLEWERSRNGYRITPDSPEHYSPENYTIKPKGGYFAPPPIDQTDNYRNALGETLSELGVSVEYHHHEVASGGQVELDFKPGRSPKEAGDMSYLYKYVSRIIGGKYGYLPTFMPKPLPGDNASGMHVHQSLWKEGMPIFYDEGEEYTFKIEGKEYQISLSQTARYYIGGILEHARGSCAICAPTVNSYRRLIPGFEAPILVTWSFKNRSALVRVPIYHTSPASYRAEVRHPDPSGNFYLQFAVLLQCGLDGIKKKIDPGDPVNIDVYKLSQKQIREYNIGRLPTTLKEALEEMQSDELLERALGKHAYQSFIDAKEKEWKDFLAYISPWDFYQYFDI